MTSNVSLATLMDKESFRRRRAALWDKNVDYWLSGPLRHVVDVGEYIVDRAESLCLTSRRKMPVVVDMGCGNAWLLREFLRRQFRCFYFGLDSTKKFIETARAEFAEEADARFEIVDLELPIEREFGADLVVNSFNFLELCDLSEAFSNASRFLREGGTLQIATIDKTYLLLAISDGWGDFIEKLRLYAELPGTKYAFQPIDLGDGVSESLLYPSVLYSTDDYLTAAREHGLELQYYREHIFTAAHVPKIYCHFEFRKTH